MKMQAVGFGPMMMVMMMLTASAANAKVIEAKKMNEILPYIERVTLVVFDLDNTVMEPTQTLGSDQWFEHLVKQGVASGLMPSQATDRALPIWESVQRVTEMQAVEKGTPALIARLQKSGHKVFALTARPQSLSATTERQLRKLGVKFERIVSQGPKACKGETLSRLIRELKLAPKRVVFVDDKEKHVKTVDEAMTRDGIESFEFRYGAADPKVEAFDAVIAGRQWGFFTAYGPILSDQEARALKGDKIFEPFDDASELAESSMVSEGGFFVEFEGCGDEVSEAEFTIITCWGASTVDLGDDDQMRTEITRTYLYLAVPGTSHYERIEERR